MHPPVAHNYGKKLNYKKKASHDLFGSCTDIYIPLIIMYVCN